MGTMVIFKGPLSLLLLFNFFIGVFSILPGVPLNPPIIEILKNPNEPLETEMKDTNTLYVTNDNTKILSFKCSSTKPTEWVFQCPDADSVYLYTVTKSRDVNGTEEESDSNQFTSNLTINITVNSEKWLNVLNMSCRYLNSSISSKHSVILPAFCNNSTVRGKCVQISQMSDAEDPYPSCENAETAATNGFKKGILQVDLETNRFYCNENNSKSITYLAKDVIIKNCGNYNDFCKSYVTQFSQIKWNGNTSAKGAFLIEWLLVKKDGESPGNIPTNQSGPWLIFCNFELATANFKKLALHVLLVPPTQRSSIHRYNYTGETSQILMSNWNLLVKPKSNQQKFWSRTKVEFQCNATLSSFFQGFMWKVIRHLGNETILYPKETDYKMNVQTHQHILTTAILLDPNVTQIQCIAPVVDSFERKPFLYNLSVTAYQPFTLHDIKNEMNLSHYILSCNASGGALPKYKWTVDAIDKSDLQMVTEGIEEQWVSSTLVLEIGGGHRVVSCIADNGVDSETKSITLLSNEIIILILAIAGVTTILGVTALVLLYKWRKKRNISRMLTVEEIDEFLQGAKRSTEEGNNEVILLPYDTNLEIPRSEIIIEETVLGSGQFGIVIVGRHNSLTVAIKTVRPTTEKAYLKALLSELKILQYVGNHPHIVNLVGACTGEIKKMEVLLILEYCANGNLVKYLRAGRTTFVDNFNGLPRTKTPPLYINKAEIALTSLDLIRMSMEIADAMNYVSQKKVYLLIPNLKQCNITLALLDILHGDLAARNVLVTEDRSVKICDFGLSKRLYGGYYVYTQKLECPLPLRWMAIESLKDMTFSMESDVWSFGVTMWELFTLAEIPYPGVNWGFDSWKLLRDGYRLEKPQFSNEAIYELMKSCWEDDPADRPPFSELENDLRTELNKLLLY